MITHPAPKRSLAPISWLLFGAGGMLAALFGPALIVLTGIMLPHGWGLPARLGDFAHVPGFARNPIGKLVVLVVIALFLWHGAERLVSDAERHARRQRSAVAPGAMAWRRC